VTIEGGSFEVEADDEDAAIDEARDEVAITADLIEDDDDEDDDEDDEDEDEEDAIG
jgi:hypothetical protein